MADDSDTPTGELQLEPVSVGSTARRRALWGVLAVIAVTVASVALLAGGGDDDLPQLPVALGGGAGERAAAGLAADSMLAWVTYVAGDELPALGGDAPAYRLVGEVDEPRVRTLAGALGLGGDPVHEDRVWRVQDSDALLEVYEDGGSWWYSPTGGVAVAESGAASGGGWSCAPDATECVVETQIGTAVEPCEPGANVDCGFGAGAEPCPADASCADAQAPSVPRPEDACLADPTCTTTVLTAEPCPPEADCVVPPPIEPTPPADLPTEDEAREIALDLLGATGMELGDAEVTVDGPYDAWYVTVEPRVDGVPVAGWVASVGVGSKGAITTASGTLGTPEQLGDYPLVDTRAAIERLNEQMGTFGGGPVPLGVAEDVVTSAAPRSGPVPGSSSVAPADDPASTTITEECTVQPDGTDLCVVGGSVGSAGSATAGIACPEVPPVAGSEGDAPETTVVLPECPAPMPLPCPEGVPGVEGDTTVVLPECPAPVPVPAPEPVEVVLTSAEPVLMLLGAFDGSGDVYLVPAYRFTNDEGAVVEAIAVADESLVPTTVPETTIPETTETSGGQVPPATRCEVLVEDDGSGTTHTIQTCPGEPVTLGPGETPEVGIGYYVDVDVECQAFLFGDRIFVLEKGDLSGWATPHEGGTFTLDSPDHGTFVGDVNAEKTATFVVGPMPDGCQPAPRG